MLIYSYDYDKITKALDFAYEGILYIGVEV